MRIDTANPPRRANPVVAGGAGLTWQTDTITMDYIYVQVIGFLDPLHGWTGGFSQLLETNDGGETSQTLFFGSQNDRFHRVHGGLAYMSGSGIYEYTAANVGIHQPAEQAYPEHIEVRPSLVEGAAEIHIQLKSASSALVEIYSTDGKLVDTLLQGQLQAGEHRLPLERGKLASGAYHITLRTNEGRATAAFHVQ